MKFITLALIIGTPLFFAWQFMRLCEGLWSIWFRVGFATFTTFFCQAIYVEKHFAGHLYVSAFAGSLLLAQFWLREKNPQKD